MRKVTFDHLPIHETRSYWRRLSSCILMCLRCPRRVRGKNASDEELSNAPGTQTANITIAGGKKVLVSRRIPPTAFIGFDAHFDSTESSSWRFSSAHGLERGWVGGDGQGHTSLEPHLTRGADVCIADMALRVLDRSTSSSFSEVSLEVSSPLERTATLRDITQDEKGSTPMAYSSDCRTRGFGDEMAHAALQALDQSSRSEEGTMTRTQLHVDTEHTQGGHHIARASRIAVALDGLRL